MKKQVIAAIVATLMLLTGLAQANAVQDSAQVFEQFSGKKIGVQTGTISGEVAQSVIPDIELSYYNSQTDALTAVRLGKIDAWATDEPIARFMIIENTDLQVIPERLDESSLAAVFAKDAEGEALCRQYSAFVDQLWADGTMEEIDSIWFGTDDTRRTVLDYKALPDTNGTLRMALDASILPFAYVKDDRVVGYDVDIAARFCQANGYRLEVVPMSFDGVLPSVQTGKCNFAACGITVTQERADSMRFSSPTYRSGTVLTVRRSDNESTVLTGAGYTRLDQLDGKMIGVQTGQSFDGMIMERLPNAIISYVNSKADLTNALMTHKIESYAVDEPVIKAQMREIDSLTYIPEYLSTFEFGYVFAKTEEGRALQEQFNDFLRTIKADGTLQEIEDRWLSPDDAQKTLPDYSRFPAPNGTLHMATEALYQPFTYILNGEIVGYDIDIAVRFCEAYGYGLEITDMSFDGILPSVKTGKADFGGAGITITPERAESVLFSEPNYAGGTVMAVLKDGNTSPAPSGVYTSVSQLDGARIGVQTGTTFDEIVLDILPDALIYRWNEGAELPNELHMTVKV